MELTNIELQNKLGDYLNRNSAKALKEMTEEDRELLKAEGKALAMVAKYMIPNTSLVQKQDKMCGRTDRSNKLIGE